MMRPIFNGGWTLVELVLVIFLITLFSVWMYPKQFSLDDFKARLAQDEFISLMRYAQKFAMQSHCQLQLSLEADQIVLKGASPCSLEFKKIQFNNFKIDSTITFYPDGTLASDNSESEIKIDSKVGVIHLVKQTGLIYAKLD